MHNNKTYTNYNSDFITGDSETFNVTSYDNELKVDVLAKKHSASRIWGQIKEENGSTVPEALVKLIKPTFNNGTIEYIDIAKCISDLNGFYQFMVEFTPDDAAYKIIISKSINNKSV